MDTNTEIKNYIINNDIPVAFLTCVLIAPFLFGLSFNHASGIGFVILTGMILALMAWSLVYDKRQDEQAETIYMEYLAEFNSNTLVQALVDEKLSKRTKLIIHKKLNQLQADWQNKLTIAA